MQCQNLFLGKMCKKKKKKKKKKKSPFCRLLRVIKFKLYSARNNVIKPVREGMVDLKEECKSYF